ncbi:response regulator [Fundidesulfovibrio terrae]|uniref:response regulator n=1 Tax=Fundidesulfovibrio terrae TaxID=2922866 RepID=UPI001FB014C4|nr:response regulator [Fundidesulfovibrio terrae]
MNQTPRRRILVADDDPVNRRLASMLLDRAGHDAVVVEDGLAAVAAFPGGFDLILLDVDMPGLTGLEAATRIRAAEKAATLPRTVVVALTGYSGHHDRQVCLEAGMDDVLVKPLTPEVLDRLLK